MALSVAWSTLADPPRVVLSVTGVSGGDRLRVVRVDPSGGMPVRGASTALVGDAAQVIDWEAPIGRQVTYAVSVLDASGGEVDATTIVVADPLPNPGCSQVWVSDPLDQTSPRTVGLQSDSIGELAWPADVAFSRPLGSAYPVASLSGIRRGLAGFRMAIIAEGDEMGDLLRLFRSPHLCVRPGTNLPGWRLLPPVMYGVAVTPTAIVGAPHDEATFAVDLTVSMGPAMAAVVAAWSWGDLAATGMTWAQVRDAYADWASLARDDRIGA